MNLVVLVYGTNLTMFPLNHMVDIVVKDWYKFVNLFCKVFLIMCDDGQQRFVKSQSFEILILWGLPLIYKAVFKYCASVFRWVKVFKAKLLTLLLLGWGLGVWNKMLTVRGGGASPNYGRYGYVILEPSLSFVTRKLAWLCLSELCVQQRKVLLYEYLMLTFNTT